MTITRHEEIVDAEIVLSRLDAEEFDTRFQAALGSYAEARQELIECVQFVRETNVAEHLGFNSRGDYVADRVSGLNVKWAVDDRRSLVELMAYDDSGGMSTRQIGAALGVTYATVQRDMKSSDTNVSDEPRKVQSSDGITRTYTGPSPEEQARKAEEAVERLRGEGKLPPRPTPEEQAAADEQFVQNLIGNNTPREPQRFTPEDKFSKALNAVGAAIRINHGVNEALLNEDGWAVLRALGLR